MEKESNNTNSLEVNSNYLLTKRYEENQFTSENLTDSEYVMTVDMHFLDKFISAPCMQGKAKKIIFPHNEENKIRKVTNQSTVYYKRQIFIVEKNSKELVHLNNDYKNEQKIEMAKARKDQSLDRICLQDLYDNAVCCYILNSKTSDEIKKMIEEKADQKRKKIIKEYKETMRDSRENKKYREQKIKEGVDPSTIVGHEYLAEELKKIESELPEYDDILVIKYFILKVINQSLPSFTEYKTYDEIIKFIKNCYDEFHYFFKKKDYTNCEKFCNGATKVFESMNKNVKSNLSSEELMRIDLEILPLLSNKALVYQKKSDNSNTLEERQKNLENQCNSCSEYQRYLKYSNLDDKRKKIILKLALRYVRSLKNLKKFADALKELKKIEEYFDDIKNKNNESDFYKEFLEVHQEVTNEYNQIKPQKKQINPNNFSFFDNSKKTIRFSDFNDDEKSNLRERYNNIYNEGIYEEDDDLEWTDCVNKIEIESKIHPSVLNLLSD